MKPSCTVGDFDKVDRFAFSFTGKHKLFRQASITTAQWSLVPWSSSTAAVELLLPIYLPVVYI